MTFARQLSEEDEDGREEGNIVFEKEGKGPWKDCLFALADPFH